MSQTAIAQDAAEDLPEPPGVRLELTMEVATTTNDGLPAALRFTLTNIGSVPIDIPMPAIDCTGSNGSIRVRSEVHFDGTVRAAHGHGCGGGVLDGLPFVEKVRSSWFRLRPGEYLIFMGDRRTMVDKADAAATYEIHAIYIPPKLTPEERRLASQNGFVIPAKTVESNSVSYHER